MAKIDCSVTMNYLREHTRMCKYHITRVKCHECPMGSSHNGTNYNCECLLFECPQKAVEIVQAWSDEHPVKTRLDDIKEKCPNIPLGGDGEPNIYPNSLGYCGDCTNCIKFTERHCWLEPVDGGATGKAVE